MKKEKQLPGQTIVEDFVPVTICGFRQNIFRRDNIGIGTKNRYKKQEKYVSLEKKTLPNGYIEELVEKDYPITSDSVSSLAEGADYHNDPLQAIANQPQRVNLGDITQAQAFLENPQHNAALFNDVKAKLAAYYSSVTKAAEEPQQNGENKEVVNNG